MAGYGELAACGHEHRGQQSNCGGLASAVGAEKADDVTLGGRKADVLDRAAGTVVLGESHRFHGHARHWACLVLIDPRVRQGHVQFQPTFDEKEMRSCERRYCASSSQKRRSSLSFLSSCNAALISALMAVLTS